MAIIAKSAAGEAPRALGGVRTAGFLAQRAELKGAGGVTTGMKRRSLVTAVLALPALPFLTGTRQVLAATFSTADIRQMRVHWRDFIPPGFEAPGPTDTLALTEQQWRERLTRKQFAVLREDDTERPGSSELNAEKRRGLFVCAGCDLPLFTSRMKYDSGTGWPSFVTAIPDALDTQTDFKMIWPRTEYHCVRCGGHQGHVFDDGPAPTHQRWCNNGVALRFLPLGG